MSTKENRLNKAVREALPTVEDKAQALKKRFAVEAETSPELKTTERLKNIGISPATHIKIKKLLLRPEFYGSSIKDLIDKLVTEKL